MPTPRREVLAPTAGGSPFEETAALRLVVRAAIAGVLGVSRDHPDVEDCTHETLSRAIEGQGRLREGEPLRPWVLGIARHVALDALRERRRARIEHAESSGGDEATEKASFLERLADPGPGPEERAASSERAQRLSKAMESLPKEPREALVLFHVDGLGYQAIARRMGVPLGTVATWISRGRRAIAEALGE